MLYLEAFKIVADFLNNWFFKIFDYKFIFHEKGAVFQTILLKLAILQISYEKFFFSFFIDMLPSANFTGSISGTAASLV